MALAESYLDRIKRSSIVLCPGGFTCTSIRDLIQSERCHAIRWSGVTAQNDLWVYGEPATNPIADSVLQSVQHHIGPRYHIPLFDRGMWIATINVAAYATGLSIANDSGPVGLVGNEFRVSVVPCSADAGVPATAEQAVRFAALRTGRKVVSRPILLNPGNDVGPGGARWRLHLDGQVSVRSLQHRSEHSVDVVYVGMWPGIEEQATAGAHLRLFIPTEQQPETDMPITWPDAQGNIHTLVRQRTADTPLLFMEVEVVAQ